MEASPTFRRLEEPARTELAIEEPDIDVLYEGFGWQDFYFESEAELGCHFLWTVLGKIHREKKLAGHEPVMFGCKKLADRMNIESLHLFDETFSKRKVLFCAHVLEEDGLLRIKRQKWVSGQRLSNEYSRCSPPGSPTRVKRFAVTHRF